MFFLVTGFLEGIQQHSQNNVKVEELTLMELTQPGAYGAAGLGAKHAGATLKLNYKENAIRLFHHIFK